MYIEAKRISLIFVKHFTKLLKCFKENIILEPKLYFRDSHIQLSLFFFVFAYSINNIFTTSVRQPQTLSILSFYNTQTQNCLQVKFIIVFFSVTDCIQNIEAVVRQSGREYCGGVPQGSALGPTL